MSRNLLLSSPPHTAPLRNCLLQSSPLRQPPLPEPAATLPTATTRSPSRSRVPAVATPRSPSLLPPSLTCPVRLLSTPRAPPRPGARPLALPPPARPLSLPRPRSARPPLALALSPLLGLPRPVPLVPWQLLLAWPWSCKTKQGWAGARATRYRAGPETGPGFWHFGGIHI